jgi:hypothetical protein
MSNTITIALSFIYINQNDRTNAVGLISSDIGKYAKQSDDSSYWILLDDSPVLWGALSSSTVDATDVTLSDIIVDDETKLSQTVVRIQNIPISPEVPVDGYSLVYDGYAGAWQPKLIGSAGTSVAVKIASGTEVINGLFNPPNDILLGPYTVPVGYAARLSVMVRDSGVAPSSWGDPSVIPTASFMWCFRGSGGSVNDTNILLTNNSAADGVPFDWALYGDPL